MYTSSCMTPCKVANNRLSSSYPNIKPLMSNDLRHAGVLSSNQSQSFTKSWNSSHSNRGVGFMSNGDQPSNSDLQPLTWLQKQSIIDIIPLDAEEESQNDIEGDSKTDSNQIGSHEEVETQENSNIQDFVRFQAQRNHFGHQRVALRQNNTFSPDITHNYSYKVNGHTKPNLSYTQLIFMAIETCKDRAMTVNDIYQWCEINYPYYKHIGPSWKNSLRHNLSINKSFRRMPREGQTSLGKCELLTSEDISDDFGSQRDAKQGGPGRGAYWVVDEKERKTLLESIYRSQQVVPLVDRNDATTDLPFSLLVSKSPKTGPLLCIDGRFTDAGTYMNTRCPDESETTVDGAQRSSEEAAHDDRPEEDPEEEFAAMMRGLTEGGNKEVADVPMKLSVSYDSKVSRPENAAEPDSTQPKTKNRRKTTHEKVRSMGDPECQVTSVTGVRCPSPWRPPTTSVNVIVAPHFDHIYARYQQFLPPAIASNMEGAAMSTGDGCHDTGSVSNPDEEFLKNGYHYDEDDDDSGDEIKLEKTTEEAEASSQHLPLSPKQRLSVVNRNGKWKRPPLPTALIKKEMIEPTHEPDGYDTDSTVPMTLRGMRRSSRVLATAATKARAFVKKGIRRPIAVPIRNERRYRSKRKRSRPLRIDECQEMSAIKILAGLERRQQHLSNINNLYKLTHFLNVTDPAAEQLLPA